MNRLVIAVGPTAKRMLIAAIVIGSVSGCGVSATGTASSPSQAPSPNASPTPVAAPSIMPLGTGQLDPGEYAWDRNGPDVSFRIPAGWTGLGTAIEKGSMGWGLSYRDSFGPATHVYADACRSEGALKPFDGTVQGLIDALDAQVGTDATVSDVTLGGQPAKRVDLVQAAGLDRATCLDGAEGPLRIWAHPGTHELDFYALAPGHRGIVHALDVHGELVIFTAAIGPEASASDVAELEAIVESIRIGP